MLGGVPACLDTGGWVIGGRVVTDGYLPFTISPSLIMGVPVTLVPDLPAHPILNGVSSFNGGALSFHVDVALTGGATLVAHWTDDEPLVATKEPAAGKIVGLNFFPPSSDVFGGNWEASTDGDWLMANALNWASGGEWPTVLFSEGFESGALPAGWNNVNNGGDCVWAFNDPGGVGNLTGGSGGFAMADSDACGMGTTMDTELRTPVMDLSGLGSVSVEFDHDFNDLGGLDTVRVDVSTNGGGIWTNAWEIAGVDANGHVVVDITALAAGQANVVVRFRYIAPGWDWWWEVDNVIVIGNP